MVCPSGAGGQRKWRVGRRRLAWPPRLRGSGLGTDDLSVAIWVLLLGWFVLSGAAALLATAVVWPVRALTGRWLVVAYKPGDPDDFQERRRWVRGRTAADSLAREWAAEIERVGALAPR